MLRGRSQRTEPMALEVEARKWTTAEPSSCTRCPFRCSAAGTFRQRRRNRSAKPLPVCCQGGVEVAQQLFPIRGSRRRQGTDNNSKSGSLGFQRQRSSFPQSPLNEVPGDSVPDGFGNNEAESAWFIGSDSCRI